MNKKKTEALRTTFAEFLQLQPHAKDSVEGQEDKYKETVSS